MGRARHWYALWLVGCMLTGCGEDLTAPQRGAIEVTSVTGGDPADPDGYALAVDGGAEQPLGPNATLTVADLPAGEHELKLAGMATNCVLAGLNPRTVLVAEGAMARTTFEVSCGIPTGSIEVSTATVGESPDPDGYLVTLDGARSQPVSGNGATAFTGVGAGAHTVGLAEVAPNCAAGGENPQTVTVGAGPATVRFEVICGPPVGTLLIATTTAGDRLDPDGYAVSVDGRSGQAIPSTGWLTVPGVPAGDHPVQLSGLAPNCSLGGDNPRSATVITGGTVTIRFSVACVLTGTGTLLFVSTRTGTSHLYRAREDGSGLRDLTLSRAASDGDWSPDGSRIAFTTHQNGGDRIGLMEADGSHLVVLGIAGTRPRWSPDGTRIVFTSGGTIQVMNADGSDVVALSAGRSPDWSPDGSLIVFDREDSTRCLDLWNFCHEDVYVMSPSGDQVRKLVTDGACAAWSPDGTRLAYHVLFVGLYVANANGSESTKIAGPEAGCPVVWSPDGTAIAYAAGTQAGTSELTLMSSTGGPGAVVSGSPASEFPESWK